MSKKRVTRVAIVCDEDCFWYVRGIRHLHHTLDCDERIYYCDEPIGGRFDTLDEACDAAMVVQVSDMPCVVECSLPLAAAISRIKQPQDRLKPRCMSITLRLSACRNRI